MARTESGAIVRGARDGAGAAHTSRQNLFDYYAGYVPKAEREQLRALLDD